MRSPVASDTRRVVFLTDDGADKTRVDAALLHQGLQPANAHVRSEQELMQTLDEGVNVILCASHWQGLDALDVLNIIRRGATRLPFIVVSHDTDSTSIVAAIRGGASDYVPMARLEGLREAIDAALARPSRRSRAGDSDSPKPSPQQIVDLGLHLQAQIDHSHASIAREIHDEIGGALTSLKFDLAWIERHDASHALRERVTLASETIDLALEASRRVSHGLRPAILEQGLIAALQWMTSRFERRTGIECSFRCRDAALQLPNGLPLTVFRTAQEALTNVCKHAMATSVSVDLSLAGGTLSLEISDNGRGFRRDDLVKPASFGILGLHERARLGGGWVDITSGERGTTLILSVPLSNSLPESEPAALDARCSDPAGWEASTMLCELVELRSQRARNSTESTRGGRR